MSDAGTKRVAQYMTNLAEQQRRAGNVSDAVLAEAVVRAAGESASHGALITEVVAIAAQTTMVGLLELAPANEREAFLINQIQHFTAAFISCLAQMSGLSIGVHMRAVEIGGTEREPVH